MQVLEFEIGTINIAFIFLEDLLIQLKGVARVGEHVNFEACMDIMDLLYEKEETSILFSSPILLAASILVASYFITVPKQRWEFPVLPWAAEVVRGAGLFLFLSQLLLLDTATAAAEFLLPLVFGANDAAVMTSLGLSYDVYVICYILIGVPHEVGLFPVLSGEEFENFTALSEKLRSDYDFGHTSDAKLIPRGESSVTKPTFRLLKPFDDLVVDLQNFEVDAMEKFVKENSVPTVAIFNQDESNNPFLVKFFDSPNAKAMLFLNFSSELIDAFKSKYNDVVVLYKGKGLGFLFG